MSNKKIDMRETIKNLWEVLKHPIIASIFGLLIGAIIIVISNENPIKIYIEMFDKSFFRLYYFLQTLTRATPIIICGIAISAAWRAGYINLGVEGQMIVGSFVATIVALYMPGPTWLVIIIAILLGMLAGALYATIAAFLNLKFNVTIVICTLMMNYIADFVTTYFVTYPFKDNSGDGLAIQSERLAESMHFPKIGSIATFNIGFIFAIVIVLGFIYLSRKTIFGYESKMTGLNPDFAVYGGVQDRKVMLVTMGLSGAIAALAGVMDIFGVKHRFIGSMFVSTGYAWTGLMAALMANLNPIGIFFSSIFLSGLQVGGQSIQRTSNVHLHMSTVIQSCITLFVSVKITFGYLKGKGKKSKIESSKTGGDL